MMLAVYLAMSMLPGPQQPGQSDLSNARDAVKELTTEVPVTESAAKERAFLDSVRTYASESKGMAPREAAEKWLALIDQGNAVPKREPVMMSQPLEFVGSLSTVFGSLPRPEVWPSIVDIVSKRPVDRKNKVLLLLFARRTGDDRSILRLCKELSHPLPGEAKPEMPRFQTGFDGVALGVLQRRRDLSAQIKRIDADLASPSPERTAQVPDLAALLGPAKAKPTLLRILLRAKSSVNIQGTATRKLAKQVVLADLGKIKRPPWELVDDARDAPFLEKLVARYGIASMLHSENGEQSATGVYLGVLLARGDVDHAAALLRKPRGMPDMESGFPGRGGGAFGFTPSPDASGRIFDAVVALQKRLPANDLWDLYATSAKAAGKAAQAARRIATLLHDPKTSARVRLQLIPYLIDLHSCLGDVAAVANDYRYASKLPRSRYNPDFSQAGMLRFALAIGNARLIEEALAQRNSDGPPDSGQRIDALIVQKRFREAEELEVQELKRSHGPGMSTYGGEDAATELCRIYYAAGRPNDAVTILQGFPFWSRDDLADVLTGNGHYGGGPEQDKPDQPLGFYAGWAFAKTGRQALAVQVLERLLWKVDTCDDAFALLNTMGGPELLGFYDRLGEGDPVNPRPLVWKADLLRRLKRLKDAETCARAAIALDPSDGAASPGRRFGAYAALGAILKSKGDLKGVQVCLRKVAAGRLAAKAENLADLGFLPQAIEAYEQSLQASPTDYIAEEHVAVCLDNCGRTAAAKAHHSRAVQLLPRCIGPGTDFNTLAWANVPNSQVLVAQAGTLAGLPANTAGSAYVRALFEEQVGKPREAVRDLKTAVKLAPRFRAALKELADLGGQGFLSQAATESIDTALIGLWPGTYRQFACDYNQFGDLRVAYKAIDRALRRLPNQTGTPLFHLRRARQADIGFNLPDRYGEPGPIGSAGSYLISAQDISEILAAGGSPSEVER